MPLWVLPDSGTPAAPPTSGTPSLPPLGPPPPNGSPPPPPPPDGSSDDSGSGDSATSPPRRHRIQPKHQAARQNIGAWKPEDRPAAYKPATQAHPTGELAKLAGQHGGVVAEPEHALRGVRPMPVAGERGERTLEHRPRAAGGTPRSWEHEGHSVDRDRPAGPRHAHAGRADADQEQTRHRSAHHHLRDRTLQTREQSDEGTRLGPGPGNATPQPRKSNNRPEPHGSKLPPLPPKPPSGVRPGWLPGRKSVGATIYHYFLDKGLGRIGASALVGNFLTETGQTLNPKTVSSSGYHGIAQWGTSQASGDRWGQLTDWAADPKRTRSIGFSIRQLCRRNLSSPGMSSRPVTDQLEVN